MDTQPIQQTNQVKKKIPPLVLFSLIGCGLLILCTIVVFAIIFIFSVFVINKAQTGISNFVTQREEVVKSNDSAGVKNSGETHDMGGLKMKISNIQTYINNNQNTDLKEGDKYISVFVEMTNDSKEDKTVSPSYATIYDINGNSYTPSFIVEKTPMFQLKTLKASGKTSGYIIFEVSKATDNFIFKYTDLTYYDASYERKWQFANPS